MTDRRAPFPLVDESPPIILRDAAGGTHLVPLQHISFALEQIAKVKPLSPPLPFDVDALRKANVKRNPASSEQAQAAD